jgi:hypothetical protein
MHQNGQEVKDRVMSEERDSQNIPNKSHSGESDDANENNGVTFITEWTVEIDPNGKRYPLTRRRIAVNESPRVNKPEKP